ncbi:dienelactone hydrolase family protein [Runella sp.]|uniref:dienelactone hydrolase family protein n=1 Tax=Runella sp. TaxID=1960881 RepID=UPI003D0A461A
MKKLILIGAMFALQAFTPRPLENPIPLCQTSAHDMAMLGADPAYQMLHEAPLPFHYAGKGETITFPTPDGKPASGFLIKSAKKSDKWLLVYQEWWGLNDHIKKEAETYSNDLGDVNVLALDMYDGQVGTTREEAGKLMQSATKERLEAIMKGGIGYAGKDAKIASVGWCFGGMLSLQSALLEGKQAVGCVMYYGRPVEDVEKLKTLNVDVLGVFGSQDAGIPPATVAKFEENMKAAGKQVTIKMYDAVHGFANPSNAKHDPVATADAYKNSLAYLKKKFS